MATLDASGGAMRISPRAFGRIGRFVQARWGIRLGSGKEALVGARLASRMREMGLEDYEEYLRRVQEDVSGTEAALMINAISTNVTSFFREPDHFEYLATAAREWIASGRRALRCWSAACSTGEEPYTITGVLAEAAGPTPVDVRILATDISTRALEACRAGRYREDRLIQVPRGPRERWFRRADDGSGDQWDIRPDLRKTVHPMRLNLAAPPYPMKGPFDAVFCRNVMIYFSDPVRRGLLGEITRLLRPGGLLFVGHAESLTGQLSTLSAVRSSIYRKPG